MTSNRHLWILRAQKNKDAVPLLCREVKLPEKIARIAAAREITDYDKARKFFKPELKDLCDPFEMKDMRRAAERVLTAIKTGEKILIYGDYDVDGTTSVSMMFSFLSTFTDRIEYYIPDRYDEGYGISLKGIDHAVDNGYTLMIALDCGIKAVEKIKYAADKDLDVIICDHHTPGNELPPAYAVLDPKRKDCNYPYKELSGCGVGFKLIQALCKSNPEISRKKDPFDLLDLTAVSIACDIVPVTGENRVLLYHGLKKINNNPSKGIKMLLSGLDKSKEVTVSNLVFVAGPRINAAGRIAHAHKAVELLIEQDDALLEESGKLINTHNENRKDLDKSITEEALDMIASDPVMMSAKSTVVYSKDWHKGVIGIVASRLIETHYKPTIVFTESNGKLAGSARSVRDFDIYRALDACSDCLEQFGGHKYAAGMTLLPEQLEDFKRRFEEVVSERIREDQTIPVIEIDAELDFNEINARFYRVQQRMAPFGPANPQPVYVSHNVYDAGYSKAVGQDGSHLKLHLKQPETSRYAFNGIAFGMADKLELLKSGVPLSIAYHLDENTFNGKTKIQLRVKDIKPVEEAFKGFGERVE